MKFSTATTTAALLMLSPVAHAFAPIVQKLPSCTSSTQLWERADASKAIQEAQAASEKYGPTSPEAKVAWDAVEEIDAADNSNAYEGTAYRMLSKEQVAEAAKQYKEQLAKLNLRQGDGQLEEKLREMKAIADEMRSIRIEEVEPEPAKDSPALRAAVEAAKQASSEFGASSPEARVAWETVEEIASSGLDNALGGMLAEECWVDVSYACEALEEVDRFINLVNTEGSGLNS